MFVCWCEVSVNSLRTLVEGAPDVYLNVLLYYYFYYCPPTIEDASTKLLQYSLNAYILFCLHAHTLYEYVKPDSIG